MASESNVDLIIKTPNLDIGDQQYKCDLNWTVKKLKSYLSNVYPTKPTVESQRLIYFGQVLSDNVILKDVFINKWKVQTIHMMCPPKKIPSKETSVLKTPVCKTESVNSNNSNVIFQNMQEQIRNTSTNATYIQGYPVNMSYDSNQIAMMQQVYTQYMMQYFQYMYSNTVNADNSSHVESSSLSSSQSQSFEANTSDEQPEENIGDDAPNRVNEANEDPLANRDIIDVTYILIRAAILLSVLYFYSSFRRCLFVIGISFFIYIYRGGFFTFRRERNRNDRRQQIQPRRHTIRNRRNRARTTNETNYNQQGAQNTQVTTVKTFIASFFTSLIPEQLNAVNIN
ncbi:homocysteine-responsive endoplasmic reticulum-resident ubiquitin-like domain member 2 protein [Centruroides vittatus]|uniref:homocysteine-responsive endoplasmic reticulum-resident ubiquitin-like domain member 2 protein n=1 Tax=Centruroides vittatus TaxID=120091 RepID=UPI00350F6B0A